MLGMEEDQRRRTSRTPLTQAFPPGSGMVAIGALDYQSGPPFCFGAWHVNEVRPWTSWVRPQVAENIVKSRPNRLV